MSAGIASSVIAKWKSSKPRIDVKAVDFRAWLKELIGSDEVVMMLKVNVEGAEVQIVKSLMEDQTFCLFHTVNIWW